MACIVKPHAFILSAGQGSRFRFELPKQLAFLAGETILGRQLRQLASFSICAFVATHDPKIIEASECVIKPRQSYTILHTLKSTQAFWCDRNHILLGDVFFSTKVFKEIVDNRQPIKFWMSGSEIYAMSFDGAESYTILDHIGKCIKECCLDSRMWHLYRSLAELPIHKDSNQPTGLSGNLVCDHTCDIDTEQQHYEVLRTLENLRKSGVEL